MKYWTTCCTQSSGKAMEVWIATAQGVSCSQACPGSVPAGCLCVASSRRNPWTNTKPAWHAVTPQAMLQVSSAKTLLGRFPRALSLQPKMDVQCFPGNHEKQIPSAKYWQWEHSPNPEWYLFSVAILKEHQCKVALQREYDGQERQFRHDLLGIKDPALWTQAR